MNTQPITGEINIGDRLIFEPNDRRFREEITVINRTPQWVQIQGERMGQVWEKTAWIQLFCIRAEGEA